MVMYIFTCQGSQGTDGTLTQWMVLLEVLHISYLESKFSNEIRKAHGSSVYCVVHTLVLYVADLGDGHV